MNEITLMNLLLMMMGTMFVLGVITFLTGIIVLALRAPGKEVQELAVQAGQLAQKGIAEDVAGLVGNASTLLDGMNQLIRTAAGVGVFLTILGLLMMGISCVIAFQIYSASLGL